MSFWGPQSEWIHIQISHFAVISQFFWARISKLLVVLNNFIWSIISNPKVLKNRRFGLFFHARFMDPVFTPWMSSTSNPSPISMARWVGPWCATRRVWTAICSSAMHGLKESSNFWGKCCTAGHEVRDYCGGCGCDLLGPGESATETSRACELNHEKYGMGWSWR